MMLCSYAVGQTGVNQSYRMIYYFSILDPPFVLLPISKHTVPLEYFPQAR